jgi:hypothetical protein
VSGSARFGAAGIPGVDIHVTGDTTMDLRTAADGSFAIAGLRTGTYTIAAESPYYTFTPPTYMFANLSGPPPDLLFDGTPAAGTAKLQYNAGWNLVSLPVYPATGDIDALLPDAVQPRRAFRYAPDTGYVGETKLRFGVGYWIKFSRSDSVVIAGSLRGDLALRLTASGGGWNLIGSVTGAAAIPDAAQSPPASLITAYQYDAATGYRLPPGDLLRPGRAYFVKVAGDMTLTLHASDAPASPGVGDAAAPSTLPDILARPPAEPGR